MTWRATLLVLALSLACAERSEPPSHPPSGSESHDTPAPEPIAIEVPSLRPVAVRHGPLSLVSDGSNVLLVDTEAWTLTPSGLVAPAVDVDASEVEVRWLTDLVAYDYIESPSGDAFLLTELQHFRSGWVSSSVYRRVEARWEPVELPSPERVSTTYTSLLVRDDAVFGLWRHHVDPEAANEGVSLESIEAEHPLPRGFAKLAGPAEVETPRVPAGLNVGEAVVGSDGTIHALTLPTTSSLLVWPPGELDPERVTLPDADALDVASLSVSGHDLWVGGAPLYLARGRDRDWTREPVEPPDDLPQLAGGRIDDVVSTPDGAVWLSVQQPNHGPSRLLYRAPAQPHWVHVPLPDPAAPFPDKVASRWWTFSDDGWFEAEVVDSESTVVVIDALTWAGGRVWIGLRMGPVLDVGGDLFFDARSLLLTVGDASEPVATFASVDDRRFEAIRAARTNACSPRFSWIVLGDGDSPPTLDEDQADAVRELTEDSNAWISSVFVAELDGREALILQVQLEDLGQIHEYAKRVSATLGVPARVDCRAWRANDRADSLRWSLGLR